MNRFVYFTIAVLMGGMTISGQSHSSPRLGKHPPITTDEVGCDSILHNRSLAVSAPNFRFRAFVELKANPESLPKSDINAQAHCPTSWTLWFSDDYGTSFQHVEIEPLDTREMTGSEFQVTGWSADSSRLLMVMTTWAGDYTRNVPVVFNTRTKKVQVLHLDGLLKRVSKSTCDNLFLNVDGWKTTNEFVMTLSSFEDDLAPNEKPCVTPSVWAIRVPNISVAQVAHKTPTAGYGLISWADSSPSLLVKQGEGFNARNPLCETKLKETVGTMGGFAGGTAEWNRCGEDAGDTQQRTSDFPEHHAVLISGSDAASGAALATVDNMTPFRDEYFFDKVVVSSFDAGQQVFIQASFYGSSIGHAWCVLDKLKSGFGCWPVPDVNAYAKGELSLAEDLCCTDWNVSLGDHAITLEHLVYDKNTRQMTRTLRVQLLPHDKRFEIEEQHNAQVRESH